MRRIAGLGLWLVGCAGAAAGEDGSTTGVTGVSPGTGATTGGTRGGATGTTGDAGGTTGAGSTTGGEATTTTGPDEWTGGSTGAPPMEGECAYVSVFEQAGPVLWVTEAMPVWELTPLQPGEGFYCMKVEFDVQTLDNLDELAAMSEGGCPEYLGLASVFGTQATGEVMATAFYRGRDREGEACVAGTSRLEVGNYLDYTADTEGPWAPGQAWHVTIEAKPWVTRISVTEGGAPLGPTIEANLWPASVADTREPTVRLGQVMVVEGRYFPWYGATYANVKVWADVAPPV